MTGGPRAAEPLEAELLLLRGQRSRLLPRLEAELLAVGALLERRGGGALDVLHELLDVSLVGTPSLDGHAESGPDRMDALVWRESGRDDRSHRGRVRGLPAVGNGLPRHEHRLDATLDVEELSLHPLGLVFLCHWLIPF